MRQAEIDKMNKVYNDYIRVILKETDNSKLSITCGEFFLNEGIRSKAGFEIDEEDVMANLKEGNVFSDIKLKPKLYKEEK